MIQIYLWSKSYLTFQHADIFSKIPEQLIRWTTRAKNLTTQNTFSVSYRLIVCNKQVLTKTLHNNSHVFCTYDASLSGARPLNVFRNVFPYLTVSMIGLKSKTVSWCWGITLPPGWQAQIFRDIAESLRSAPVALPHMRLNCQLTAGRKQDHRTKHKRIQGEPAFYSLQPCLCERSLCPRCQERGSTDPTFALLS